MCSILPLNNWLQPNWAARKLSSAICYRYLRSNSWWFISLVLAHHIVSVLHSKPTQRSSRWPSSKKLGSRGPPDFFHDLFLEGIATPKKSIDFTCLPISTILVDLCKHNSCPSLCTEIRSMMKSAGFTWDETTSWKCIQYMACDWDPWPSIRLQHLYVYCIYK